MRYKDFHGGKKNPYSPTEELVIEVEHISILPSNSNDFTGSQEQSLRIEQVEMLWGLETGGFRLCYYRSVTVKANQQAVNSPALVNCAEFVLDKQIITVVCGADEFSNITPHGFLSLFILFLQELEFCNLFALLDPPEKEVIYSTTQKIQTVIASIAVGCTYNSDINHQLVPYTVEAELLGLKRFPDQSQISRFLRHMTDVSLSQMATIFSLAAHYYSLTSMLPVKVDIDIDSTGLIANGRTYQLNRKGYFSKRRGEKGYQLSMCIAALTGDVLAHSFMPGNHSAPADFIDLIYGAAEVLGSFDRLGIIRADAGYGKSYGILSVNSCMCRQRLLRKCPSYRFCSRLSIFTRWTCYQKFTVQGSKSFRANATY